MSHYLRTISHQHHAISVSLVLFFIKRILIIIIKSTMQNNPLNKVVFIQKVVAFTPKANYPLEDLFQLAYVNNSWNDTIKNYSFHIFEQILRELGDAIECDCDSLLKCDVTWFVEVLLTSRTLLDSVNLPRLICSNEVCSLNVSQVIFEKIFKVGGKELLRSQLTASDVSGNNCLMLGGINSVPPEVMNLVCEKMVEVGGNELLMNQLAQADRQGKHCLMLVISNYDSSLALMKIIFEKILEAGGSQFLKSQLVATTSNGWSCLMLSFLYCDSSEVLTLIIEKIVEAGGTEFIKNQLAATDADGSTALMLSCEYSQSREVVKLTASVLLYLDLFDQQYAELDDRAKEALRKKVNDEIKDASWTPDAESIAEVKKIFKCKKLI